MPKLKLVSHRGSVCVGGLLFVAFYLAACSHRQASPPSPRQPKAVSDSVLKSEFENPKDPEIKAALAVTYWCAGQIGLAYEHWLWLVQFEAQSVRGIQAKNYVETLHQNSSSRLPISCPQ